MAKVKALECSGKGEVQMRTFELPKAEKGCVLLKILSCGICGTDLHGIEGKRAVQYPFIPGHEIVAVIDQVGEGADRTIKIFGASSMKVGMRVTINPRIVCGKCFFCMEMPGAPQKCLHAVTATSIGSKDAPHLFGGFAEYFYVLPGSELIALKDDIDPVFGVLVEPFSCGVGLVDRHRKYASPLSGNGVEIREPVVVYGAGAIGMLMIAAFSLAGAKTIVAVDSQQNRLELAREFGATFVINAADLSGQERIAEVRRITNGIGAGIAVESCGVPSYINEGVLSLRRGGRLYEVGHLLNAGMAEVDPYVICRNEIEVLGNYAYPSSNTMKIAAELLSRRDLPYEKLVHPVPFENAVDVILNRKFGNAVKPVFVMGE
jgi:threonine dehydrogenase-like Zn-dependent dehydrogenase